ncbi:hypothetical protein JOE11_004038 [Robbsia andropogonis]
MDIVRSCFRYRSSWYDVMSRRCAPTQLLSIQRWSDGISRLTHHFKNKRLYMHLCGADFMPEKCFRFNMRKTCRLKLRKNRPIPMAFSM